MYEGCRGGEEGDDEPGLGRVWMREIRWRRAMMSCVGEEGE